MIQSQAKIPLEFEEPDYTQILEYQDFFPKVFLTPSEIKLDPIQGIKVIKRTLQKPDKFQQERVSDIHFDQSKIANSHEPDDEPSIAGHGLLSLFKRTQSRRIKLAICICVYSQPKHMLKNTIKGIQQSYNAFREKAGILPHQIIITVIFDGIEKLNNSNDQTENMISFFDEIDMKNGFTNKLNGKSIDEYFKHLEEQNFNISRLQEDNDENFTLFTSEEMHELQSKLFKNQYEEYIRIKELIKQIQQLKKKKNLRLDSISVEIYKKYEDICKDFCIQNNLYFDTQEQIQQYLDSRKNIRTKLIYKAISETQLLCKRYIQSRQDKVILYPARLETEDLVSPKKSEDEEEEEKFKKSSKTNYNYMFFGVKYRNEGKLSSHMLFFEGFCKLFDPQYCILTDVGMKPKKNAIYKMWEYMELNKKCGGVCGYMNLKLQNGSDDLGYRFDGFDKKQVGCLTRFTQCIFSIQRAQQFQYHYAHMLDKPFEAAFKYIHVLPGAFSAYRWKALKSIAYHEHQPQYFEMDLNSERQFSHFSMNSQIEQQQTIMKRYLKTALVRSTQINLQDSNMYLAEDRIMCLGIHALGYDIQYLPDAQSTVDPVTSLTRLLGQRRRWINGSWFAFNYVRRHWRQRTSCIFLIQILYYLLVQILSWIGPGLFFITMNLTLVAAVREYVVPIFLNFFGIQQDYGLAQYWIGIFNIKSMIQSIPDIINYVYIMLMFSIILYSVLVNNNNDNFKTIYYSASTAFGIYGLIVIVLLVYNTYLIFFKIDKKEQEDFIIPVIYIRASVLFIIIGHGLPILLSFSPTKQLECCTSLFSYIFYIPTYINLLQVFAFCRIDDLSWGTKGLDSSGEPILDETQQKIVKEWARRKYVFILQYVSTNVVFSFIIMKLCDYDETRNAIIIVTMYLVAFLLLFRLIPSLIYLFKYTLKRAWGKRIPKHQVMENLKNGNRILHILRQIELKSKEIQKKRVKKKKEEQYKQAALLTSKLLSKNLNNIGTKLRSRVTQHMLNNNIFMKKDIDSKKSNKKRINLRKKLKIVEEASLQDSDGSMNRNKSPQNNYQLRVPEHQSKDGSDIKSKLKALKMKRNQQKER